MQQIISFMCLVFVFSISLATANTAVAQQASEATFTSMVISPTPHLGQNTKLSSLLPELLPIISNQEKVAHTKFLPPSLKSGISATRISLPIIGWGNINCYGGTGARFARG